MIIVKYDTVYLGHNSLRYAYPHQLDGYSFRGHPMEIFPTIELAEKYAWEHYQERPEILVRPFDTRERRNFK